jgi:hypothetical protein
MKPMQFFTPLALAWCLAAAVPTLQAQSDEGIEVQVSGASLQLNSEKIRGLERQEALELASFATDALSRLQSHHYAMTEGIEALEEAGTLRAGAAQEALEGLTARNQTAQKVLEELLETHGNRQEPVKNWLRQHLMLGDRWQRELKNDPSRAADVPPVGIPAAVDGALEEGKTQVVVSNTGVVIYRYREGGEKTEIFRLGEPSGEAEDDQGVDRGEMKRLARRIDSLQAVMERKAEEVEKEAEAGADSADSVEDSAKDALSFLEKRGLGSESKSKKLERTESYLDIGFGFNQNLEEGQFLVQDIPGETNFWKSSYFHLGTGGKTRLGNPYSKLYLKYGIDFSWNTFHPIGSDVLRRGDTAAFFAPVDTGQSYETNKFSIAYFNVPVMFQLDFSEVGERDESFTLGLGGYAGIRMRGKRELEYATPTFERVEEEVRDDFYTSQFRYGLMAEVGYGNFKLRAQYDLNPFFRQSRGPAYNLASLGLTLTF